MRDAYLKRRKRATFVFFSSIYLFCIEFMFLKFDILSYEHNAYLGIINTLICLYSIMGLIYMNVCKRTYKKIEIPNHNEIIVFKKKELFFLLLPVLISAYFMPLPIIGLLCFIGSTYLVIDRFNRPYNPVEDKL